MFRWLKVFCLFLFCLANATAQTVTLPPQANPNTSSPGTFDLDRDRQSLVSLDGRWRRQIGDNPAWADPQFDDSGWSLIKPTQPWQEQTFSGTCWYRAKIRVPANQGPLALYLYYIDDSYQVFVDGKLIRSAGGMPPHPHAYGIPPTILTLPRPSVADQPYTLTLAIRVWLWPGYAADHQGGILPGSLIGDPSLIQAAYKSQISRWAWGFVSSIFLAILESLAALAAFILFYFRKNEQEYLWFALTALAFAAGTEHSTYYEFHTLGVNEFYGVTGFIAIIGGFAEIGFYYRLLDGKRNWLFWVAIAANLAALFFSALPAYFGLVDSRFISTFLVAVLVAGSLWILVLLIRRARQGFPDARLLLVPFFFSRVASLVGFSIWILFAFHLYSGPANWFDRTLSWPFDISLGNLGDFLFLVAMLAILIYRFTRTRLHEESYEREREAARSVQQVLVPHEIPATPGFEIASIYKPFGEVGGDFFQVRPIESGVNKGAVLIVIGDVSGKGMPAAMTVSLLVGTFRTLAHYTHSPSEILAAMNQRMVGRSNGGFTTCLVLRADPGGALTFANAGHVNPYQSGFELPLQTGLPLGLTDGITYSESTYQLSPREQITLITDGVVEARSKTGELYGFDRTAAVSNQTAASIAQAAFTFGQDDDITVLTFSRLATPVSANP